MIEATVSSSGLRRVGPKQTPKLLTVIKFFSDLAATLKQSLSHATVARSVTTHFAKCFRRSFNTSKLVLGSLWTSVWTSCILNCLVSFSVKIISQQVLPTPSDRLTDCRYEPVVVLVGHQRFRQVPQVTLEGAGDGLGLPLLRVV
jgi:hypothetical protein